MSVLWQTGEPPCGVELLIEYRHNGRATILRDIAKLDKRWWSIGVDFRNDITVLRWSTLDAAPDVIGRLEEYAKKHFTQSVLIDYMVRQDTFEIGRYDPSEGEYHDTTSAPTIAAAIEQLCEKQ